MDQSSSYDMCRQGSTNACFEDTKEVFLAVGQAGQSLSNLPVRDGALVATEQQFVGFLTQGHPETPEFVERKRKLTVPRQTYVTRGARKPVNFCEPETRANVKLADRFFAWCFRCPSKSTSSQCSHNTYSFDAKKTANIPTAIERPCVNRQPNSL